LVSGKLVIHPESSNLPMLSGQRRIRTTEGVAS
jgi:hypothetical protein